MDYKKTLLLTLTTLLWASMSWAAPVSQSQALKNAKAFMDARGISFSTATARVATRAPRRAAGNTQAVAYYVFNDANQFFISAGDDTMPSLLGYST
ncbi:MAG: Spi family protease inhibitor, partial [Bacteroidales bacterium]|nr:Spi family protease inhibitor [Candidatus Sodaliphilus aphodohippi]